MGDSAKKTLFKSVYLIVALVIIAAVLVPMVIYVKYVMNVRSGKADIQKGNYSTAVQILTKAAHYALFPEQTRQIQGLLNHATALNSEYTANMLIKQSIKSEDTKHLPDAVKKLSNALNLERQISNVKGIALVDHNLGLVREKIGLSDMKNLNSTGAVKEYEESHNDFENAIQYGAKDQLDSIRVGFELNNAKLSQDIVNAQRMWKDGKQSQAVQTLNAALEIHGDTSKLSNARALLYTYKGVQDEEQKQAEIQQISKEKTNMRRFEGDGNVAIAVGQVQLRQSTDTHSAGSGMTFVYLWVGVLDSGTDPIDANPLNFTLSTPNGQTQPVSSDTFGASNYLDSTTLNSNQQADGWIIFYMPKAPQYTLYYNDYQNSAEKVIIP